MDCSTPTLVIATVAAIAGVAAAIGAIITAAVSWRQVQGFRASLQAETMLKLLDRFDSDSFRQTRETAATACVSQNPDAAGAAVEDVLEFFDDAAFLVEKNALDAEMMWHSFYHWIRLYLQAGEPHITTYRTAEPSVWKHLFAIYPRLTVIEKAQGRGVYVEKLNNPQLKRQLEQEIY